MAEERPAPVKTPAGSHVHLPPPEQCCDHCDCDIQEGQEHMQADPPPEPPRDPRQRQDPAKP